MKKKFIYLFFLLSSVNLMGVTLDDLIYELESGGYSREFRGLEEDSLRIEERKIELIDRDGIEVDGSSSYSDDNRGRGASSDLSAKYDIFKYQGSYDHERGDTQRELIGIEKDLKDLFYSERRYESTLFDYTSRYRLNLEDARLEEDTLGLISLYREYMDALLELRLKNELLPGLQGEYEAIRKHFEVGTGTEVDYRYSEVRLINAESEIAQLEDDIKKLRKDFYENYRISLGEREIERVVPSFSEDSLGTIGSRDLENIDLQLKQARENYSYSKYDNKWPEINAGSFYDSVNDGWLVSLSLNKVLFEYDDTSELFLVEAERLQVEYEQKEKSVAGLRRDYENRYTSLTRETENLKRQRDVDEMKYNIYRLMYEQGTKSYIDYVEQYDEFVSSSIAYDKKSNELDALVYEIKYRD